MAEIDSLKEKERGLRVQIKREMSGLALAGVTRVRVSGGN